MAKRRKSRTRTVRVVKTIRRGGGFKGILDGVIAGAIASVIPDTALWGLGDALGITAVGYFTRNSTLKTLGGFMIGGKLLSAMGIFGKKEGPGMFL